MRVGVALPNQLASGESLSRGFAAALSVTKLVRELGFEGILAGEHYLSVPYPNFSPVPFLARLAADAGKMDLVALNLLPLHNPVAVAEEMATLAALAEGRVVLAAALGYREAELRAFGVDPKHKVARFSESLKVIEALWREEEVEHKGRFFEVPSSPIHTRPEAGREPSIWIAASSEPAVRRAAVGGYTWLIEPASHLDIVAQQRRVYDEAFAGEGGGPIPGVAIIREVLVDESSARAREVAASALVSKYATYRQLGHAQSISPDEDFATGFDELAAGRFIVGSPAECVDLIAEMRERFPVDWLFVHSHWPGFSYDETLRSLRTFSEKVMPEL